MSARAVHFWQNITARSTTRAVTVYPNFPNKTLYALNCVMKTSLGQNIVQAAIPCCRAVLHCANKFKYVTVYLLRMMLLFLIAVVVLSCPSLVAQPWAAWVFRASAVVAAVYMLSSLLYFGFIYAPLRIVVMPLALVYRVDHVEGFTNDFIEVEVNQHMTAVQVDQSQLDLSQHVFAARLQQQERIKFMVYRAVWFSSFLGISGFLADLILPLFFLISWALRDEVVHVPAVVMDEPTPFAETILSMAATAMFVGTLIVVGVLVFIAWSIVDMVLCFLPRRLLNHIRESMKNRVVRRMDGNAADMVSFC